MGLNDHEWSLLEQACAVVPRPAVPPALGTDSDYPDYVTNPLLTVLDLRLQNSIVKNAIEYYWKNRWYEVRTLDDLQRVLAHFPDNPEGNRAAAKYLWGYLSVIACWLRGLVSWARRRGLTDQARLRDWAHTSDFRKDFAGQVKRLGIAAYCWLLMRLGADTVKPDVWLHGFIRRVLGQDLDDIELVEVISEAAHRVGRRARELDAGIWETERGGPGSI